MYFLHDFLVQWLHCWTTGHMTRVPGEVPPKIWLRHLMDFAGNRTRAIGVRVQCGVHYTTKSFYILIIFILMHLPFLPHSLPTSLSIPSLFPLPPFPPLFRPSLPSSLPSLPSLLPLPFFPPFLLPSPSLPSSLPSFPSLSPLTPFLLPSPFLPPSLYSALWRALLQFQFLLSAILFFTSVFGTFPWADFGLLLICCLPH